MERQAEQIAKMFYFVIDWLLTGLAFFVAYQLKLKYLGNYSGLSQTVNYQFLLIILLYFCSICYYFFSLYQPDRHLDPLRIFASIVKAVLTATACTLIVLFILHQEDVSRLLLGVFVVLDILFLFSSRLVRLALYRFGKKKGRYQKYILIIGSHERAKDLIRYLKSVKHFDYNIIGCLDVVENLNEMKVSEDVLIVGTMKNFRTFLLNFAVDEIVFAMPLEKIENAVEYIAFAEKLGINVRFLPDWQIYKLAYQPEVASVYVEDFVGMPMLALSSTPRRIFELTFKELLDRSIAFLSLFTLAPLLAIIALLIKLTSRGPVLFKQQRCGLNGRIFYMYKFRSMVANAEELRKDLESQNEQDGPVFKIAKDPRNTRVGSFLRKTSLDELPQLINVVKGDMSLVGPRPPLPDEVKLYDPWQRRRLSMKPGITCIWQVSGRNSIDFEQWMRMDLEYIDKWNLILDFKLLLRTVPAVLFGTGR